MKYLFYLSGLLLFVAGVILALRGVLDGFDAMIALAPILIGIGLMGVACGIHIYDNWDAKN